MKKGAVLLLLILSAASVCGEEGPPVFRSSTAVVALEVGVVDGRGHPLPDLAPGDFQVLVDGKPRPVVFAEYRLRAERGVEAVASPPRRYSSNEGATAGRQIVIAVDQGNISTGAGRVVLAAAERLLGRLGPADRVALVTLPPGSGPQVDFTAEPGKIRAALERVVGQARFSGRRVAFGEAIAYARDDQVGFQRAIDRECGWLRGLHRTLCENDVREDASLLATTIRHQSDISRKSLRNLAARLRAIEGDKTVLFVSEGLVEDDAMETASLGAAIAAARVSLFVLLLDSGGGDATVGRLFLSAGSDRRLYAGGLERLASFAGGSVLRITGTGDAAFDRIATELSGGYLVGFEPEDAESDGRFHSVRVVVRRDGAVARSRSAVHIPRPASTPEPPEAVLAGVLRAPGVVADLPVRVATFVVREPGTPHVRVLLSSEIGRDSAPPPPGLSVAFLLSDERGRPVTGGFERIADAHAGPAVFVGATDVPPGTYRLRLAALDERGLRGSVDHTVKATLTDAGQVELSDLILSGAAGSTLRPDLDPVVAREGWLAYLELYARDPALLELASVALEVAQGETGPALASSEAHITPSSEPDRRIVQGTLPVGDLPAGEYLARAVVSLAGQPVRRLSQPFRVTR